MATATPQLQQSPSVAKMLEGASGTRNASFDFVMKAYFERDDELVTLMKRFERVYGPMEMVHFGQRARVGVALTLRRTLASRVGFSRSANLHIVTDCDLPPSLVRLLGRARQLADGARELLLGRPRRTCLERIYDVTVQILCQAELQPPGTAPSDEAVSAIAAEFDEIDRYYQPHARVKLLLNYLLGMISGAGLMALFGYLLQAWTETLGDRPALYTAFVAGGIGAVVSAMVRISTKGFELPQEMGRLRTSFAGAFRPVIGCIFAVLVFAFLASGLSTSLGLPPDTQQRIYFVLVIGFLSGFSERFAKDILVKAEGTITGTSGETDAERPATSVAAVAPAATPSRPHKANGKKSTNLRKTKSVASAPPARRGLNKTN